ncbi:MAG: hypothetical protein ACLFU2_08690 [Opitutales bacterium]
MLELGNQRIARGRGVAERTGKTYFTHRGVEHTAIDFNGKDGALPYDLSKPIDRPDWMGAFDIVTNSGTTEHVEPFEGQFTCFESIHNWLKPGGITVHIVPAIEELEANGRWRNHCNIYYSKAFFDELARLNSYEVIESTVMNDLRAVSLRKTTNEPFTTDRERFFANLTLKAGGIEYFGVNDPRRRSLHAIIRTLRRKVFGRAASGRPD